MSLKLRQPIIYILTLLFIISSFLFNEPIKKAQAFDYNRLCDDSAFINTNTLSAYSIQKFLEAKGSFLRSYSVSGRSAARIIYDAAMANKINPVTILAMVQKEEGIVYGTHASTFSQVRVDWAMGYGYTEDIIYQKYKGFATQIDMGAWQLRRNMDYWAANGSDWNVGKTMNIDGLNVTFGNRCTSALYRYTPHLGTNFTYYFNLWSVETKIYRADSYQASYWTQGPRTGTGAPGDILMPGETFILWVYYKNTGAATWYRSGSFPVRLGTSSPPGRKSPFLGYQSLRGSLVSSSVAPGQVGCFQIRLTVPKTPGVYYERFTPVVEGIKWMGPEATWKFQVGQKPSAYSSAFRVLGPHYTSATQGLVLSRGQSVTLWVYLKNTGRATWYQGTYYPTRIGTANPDGRKSIFLGNQSRRGYLVQRSVPPGGIGTFQINVTAPRTPGRYVEYFRPVTEYITWFGSPFAWLITVK